jgi:hypothetical protein
LQEIDVVSDTELSNGTGEIAWKGRTIRDFEDGGLLAAREHSKMLKAREQVIQRV